MKMIEPRLVMFIKLSTNSNVEMTEVEILIFVNNYTAGSSLEQDVISWKLRNNIAWRKNFYLNQVRLPKELIYDRLGFMASSTDGRMKSPTQRAITQLTTGKITTPTRPLLTCMIVCTSY